MAVVQIVRVAVVIDGNMPTARAMLMFVSFMFFTWAHRASPKIAETRFNWTTGRVQPTGT